MVDTTAHGGEHQQPAIKLYLLVWGLLFVLSAFSYMVDYLGIQGYPRYTLILLFMMLKAGLIVAISQPAPGRQTSGEWIEWPAPWAPYQERKRSTVSASPGWL